MSPDRWLDNLVDDVVAVDLIVAVEPTTELNIRLKLCIWWIDHIDFILCSIKSQLARFNQPETPPEKREED